MKNLDELQAECAALGIEVKTTGRANKEPYVAALRDAYWRRDHPNTPLPPQVMPMLLGSWDDLEDELADAIENDHHAWIVQPKLDGVRALLHIEEDSIRITSRNVSDVSYRLSEFQENLPHLTEGLSPLGGSVLDGELVCPISSLDTGSTVTECSLQATMAVLAASPNKARRFQEGQQAHVRFHSFDVLRFRNRDVTPLTWMERQEILDRALRNLNNAFLEPVPSFSVNKPGIHRRIIDSGSEGTVWKRADSLYQPGRRVNFWIKRKREIEVEAFVTGFKPGTNGHAALVGAIEFAVRNAEGSPVPIAWVSNLTDADRTALTDTEKGGGPSMNPSHFGRRAVISGHGLSSRAKRFQHARLVRWIDK